MAPRARGDEHEAIFIDAVDEQPVRLDVVPTVSAVRSAQGMVMHRLGKGLSVHGSLKDGLELREVLSRLLMRL